MTVVRIDTKSWSKKSSPTFAHTNTVRNVGLDLHTLLALGLVRQQKKDLFRMYLSLPFQQIENQEGLSTIMHPSSIYYIGHGGGHDSPQLIYLGEGESKTLYRGVYLKMKARVRLEAKEQEDPRFGSLMHEMTTEDTEGGEFSLIEYNSGSGLLSTAIAERYPRATIIR